MSKEFPKTFLVTRQNDETGVSGTGEVIEGVIFHTGQVVITWKTPITSTTSFESMEDFLKIHIHSHPTNRSIITFSDGTTQTY